MERHVQEPRQQAGREARHATVKLKYKTSTYLELSLSQPMCCPETSFDCFRHVYLSPLEAAYNPKKK